MKLNKFCGTEGVFLLLFSLLKVSFILELEESMLDAFGILPKRKQHKKLLLVCMLYVIGKYFC